MIDMYQIAEKI